MRNLQLYIAIAISIIVYASCQNRDRDSGKISIAIALANSQRPDSALALLSSMNQTILSNHDLAMYSLAYTLAQDKSGINVDNDSLIRTAYEWYSKNPNDSLYSRCLYYMGKYYSLNDSSEKALSCLNSSMELSRKEHDYQTLCLALSRSASILREYKVDTAICQAKEVVNIYNKVLETSNTNKAYGYLILSECYAYKDGMINKSIASAYQALQYARMSHDSTCIADVYQDLSWYYTYKENVDSSLISAYYSYNYGNKDKMSSRLNLCQSLYNAGFTNKAKQMLSAIPETEYNKGWGSSIFYLKRIIAMEEHEYSTANCYADSEAVFLKKENSDNLAAKNTYYRLMLKKEQQRTKYQSEISRNRILTIVVLIASVFMICLLSFIYKQRRNKMEQEIIWGKKEAERKDLQLATARSYLIKKIKVTQKIEAIQKGKAKNIVLTNDDFEEMEALLNSVDDQFVERLKRQFQNLTAKDLRFLMLVRLRLPVPILSTIYHIEEKSVRQKLFLIKSKLGICNEKISAKEFIERF